jgi:hypothetical protein
MSTDNPSPFELFYKSEAAVDQLPEQYPLLPQKTQLKNKEKE